MRYQIGFIVKTSCWQGKSLDQNESSWLEILCGGIDEGLGRVIYVTRDEIC